MAIKPKRAQAEAKMDMTPMIDIVFQLLIFFILVTELQRLEIEPVALPKADQAEPDVDPPSKRTVINVTDEGKVIVRRRTLTLASLDKLLRVEAQVFEEGDKPILIRADREVEYGVVQDIMGKCVENEIWKLSFGAASRRSSNEAETD